MKKAIIIGATSGIGKALAEILLRENYMVGVTGRREALLATLQESDSSRVFIKKMDVQDVTAIELICDYFGWNWGRK
jgi:NADP-dependent 3-hydroxy acid dehydrogenase YdfG